MSKRSKSKIAGPTASFSFTFDKPAFCFAADELHPRVSAAAGARSESGVRNVSGNVRDKRLTSLRDAGSLHVRPVFTQARTESSATIQLLCFFCA